MQPQKRAFDRKRKPLELIDQLGMYHNGKLAPLPGITNPPQNLLNRLLPNQISTHVNTDRARIQTAQIVPLSPARQHHRLFVYVENSVSMQRRIRKRGNAIGRKKIASAFRITSI